MLEVFGIALLVLLVAALWLRAWPGPGRVFGALVVTLFGLLAVVFWPPAERAPRGAPELVQRGGYVSSAACRSCHPAEHASWHRSYHRTMTQLASPSSVRAPFTGPALEVEGRSIGFERRGDEYWATLPDPDAVADAARAGAAQPSAMAPLVSRRVIMTTGSHHYQAYWVSGRRGNELRLLPAVYLFAEQRWVPRQDAFLQPPGAPARPVRWNSNCVMCHAVAGRPEHDESSDRFATEAAELGIACEACHGPGAEHVRKHQNPARRYLARFADDTDESIVDPRSLGAEASAELCGQCHAYFVPRDEAGFWKAGFSESYRAGQRLGASRLVLSAEQAEATSESLIDADFGSLFWPDGTIRIGGREYNGLVRSACYERGQGKRKLSCLSCHSMHDSEPDDQLSRKGNGDGACASCHEGVARAGSAHTHHAQGSAGGSCYGCHMPHTSYALFKGIRSHRIDSPSVAAELASGRPNACNLCHTDRSLDWTAEQLQRWYGQPRPELAAQQRELSATLYALHTGDAARRAIAAFALGRAPAPRAGGAGYQAAHLATLLDDPYSAVRLVAYRALLAQPGFAAFDYDFLAPADERAAAVERALSRIAPPTEARPELLLAVGLGLDRAKIAELRRSRDERPITIAE